MRLPWYVFIPHDRLEGPEHHSEILFSKSIGVYSVTVTFHIGRNFHFITYFIWHIFVDKRALVFVLYTIALHWTLMRVGRTTVEKEQQQFHRYQIQ